MEAVRTSRRASEVAHQPLLEYSRDGTGEPCVEGFIRFCWDLFGILIWSKQREALELLFDTSRKRRTAVRSGHSVGKTMLAALLVEYWFSALGRCVRTTAPGRDAVTEGVWRQLRINRDNALQPERLPGFVLESGKIKVPGRADWWASGFSTNKSERAQGRHVVGLLIVVDEAAGVEDFIWDAVESSMASDDCRIFAIGNPNERRNTFYAAFHEAADLWHQHHISSLDSPNITGTEPAIPGLATIEWVEDQKKRYGVLPDTHEDQLPKGYIQRVLGNFCSDADEKTVPMEWIRAAQRLWIELREEEKYYVEAPKIHCAFLDVAGVGKDKSSFSYLRGQRVHVDRVWQDKSPEGLMLAAEYIAKWVKKLNKDEKPRWIGIDCDAIGAGVWSRLCQLKRQNPEWFGATRIVKLHWGSRPDEKQLFCFKLDELYWRIRMSIAPTTPREQRIALPPDSARHATELAAQLNLRSYDEDIQEKIKVQSKDELHRRGKRSPDVADSIAGLMLRPKLVNFRIAA